MAFGTAATISSICCLERAMPIRFSTFRESVFQFCTFLAWELAGGQLWSETNLGLQWWMSSAIMTPSAKSLLMLRLGLERGILSTISQTSWSSCSFIRIIDDKQCRGMRIYAMPVLLLIYAMRVLLLIYAMRVLRMLICYSSVWFVLQVILMQLDLQLIVRLLREKQKLIVVGQYRYNMRHIVMSLNNTCIDFIKQEFQFNDNRLDLLKFVWLMRQALDQEETTDYFICYELVKLFQEIDIDNSITIEWSQFLEYLSQSNWLSAPPQLRPANAKDGSLLVHAFHQQAKYRKYALRRVVELARHNSLALLGSNHALTFLSLDRTSNPDQHQPFTLSHVDSSRVLALDYAEEERLFGVLLTNRNLVFVEDGEMQKSLGVVRSSGNEVDIRYLPLHRLWVVESVNSSLQVFASPKGGALQGRMVFRPHEQPLTAVREVGWPLTLCTASLDGLLKLWQVGNGRLVIELDVGKQRGEAQRKGVKGVATYNRAGVAFLCTWMFTSEIFLWLPSLSLSKPFAGELHGHLGLVTDCVFAWRGELVSLDDKRAVRVWNPEKLECVQSFTIGEEGCSLLVLRTQPYLLTYSRLLDFYRLRTNSKADLQSEVGSAGRDGRNVLALQGQGSRLLAVQFSAYYSFLVVLTSQQLKIFDVNAPASIAAIRPPNSFEFVAAAMKGSRRVCLATSAGTVEERKVQDGQLMRKIDICTNLQAEDLKFILYHEETRILLAVVQGETFSKLITFDMLGEQSIKLKEIQFQQLGLLQLRAFANGHRLFLLSADAAITVWDYDKLAILNRIDLQVCIGNIISGTLSFFVESNNQCLFVHSSKGVAILWIDSAAAVQDVTVMQFSQDVADVALLLQRIPHSYLQQERAKRTKREMQFEGKKKVDFQMFEREVDPHSTPDTLQQIFIMAVAHKKGEVNYFRLDDLLNGNARMPEAMPLRGKVQRVKEHRRAHMRPFMWNGKTLPFNISTSKFTEEYSFISGVQRAGTTLGLFYFHTSQNQLYFLSPYAQMRAEWALSLPRPKIWSISYNEIEEVLARLEKTQRVLQQIYQISAGKFKVDFLTNKYLIPEEIEELRRAQERAKKASKSNTFLGGNQQITSKKSIISINDNLGKSSEKEEKTAANPVFRKQTDNLFDKKLQEHEKRRMVHRNSKDLFQKVQRSLSYSRLQQPQPQSQQPHAHPQQKILQASHPTPQRAEKSNFAAQMQLMLSSALKQSQPLLENSSVKSGKKERSSINAQGRPQSNIFRSRSSGLKNRIKSSLGELSKNFTAGKIEWQNFKKGIGEGLAKRGKLKL